MTRPDLAHFTTLPLRQLDAALDGLRRLEDEEDRALFDVPRGLLPRETPSPPVRFLPSFDSAILAHKDRRRIIPAEYHADVIRDVNATTMRRNLARSRIIPIDASLVEWATASRWWSCPLGGPYHRSKRTC